MGQQRGPAEHGASEEGTQVPGSEDWIFTPADPGTLPTDRLPGAEDLERLIQAHRDGAAQAGTGGVLAPRTSRPAAPPRSAPSTRTDELALGRVAEGGDENEVPAGGTGPLPSYARSGTTPSDDDEVVLRGIALPERFSTLSWWDAVRDVLALVCLTSAYTTPLTVAGPGGLVVAARISIVIALVSLLGAHALRWIPRTPPLRAIRALRVIGQVPAVLCGLAVSLLDLVTSIPVLFASLPDGPPVGVGVGTALLLVGALVAIEPRAHEGFVPGDRARTHTRRALLGILGYAAATFALSLVMETGRVFTTGWAFSVLALADGLISALVLTLVITAGLRRESSRFVLCVAAVAGLVIAAVCHNTLRLQFAQAESAATGYVYLPLLFSAFAIMVSRSFVRSMPLSFRRTDWILYTVRAFDFSIIVHLAAALWCALAALAALGGAGSGGPVLHLVDGGLALLFAGVSAYGRRALLERPADTARATGVAAGVVLVIIGFLDVIVNSVATGAGAGLATGGVALAIGIAASLMLTVPAPVRDEYGAPDLARMYEDFRRRHGAAVPGPDVDRERARRKAFPGR